MTRKLTSQFQKELRRDHGDYTVDPVVDRILEEVGRRLHQQTSYPPLLPEAGRAILGVVEEYRNNPVMPEEPRLQDE